MELNPSLVDYMFTATSKLRWDEQNAMPQTQVSYDLRSWWDHAHAVLDTFTVLEIDLIDFWRHRGA